MAFLFNTPHQYFLVHQGQQFLYVLWEEEQVQQLYLVAEEADESTHLYHPGKKVEDQILFDLQPVLFVMVEENHQQIQTVLGATFIFQGKRIGYYYPNDANANTDLVYFFDITNRQVEGIPQEQNEQVIAAFQREFADYLP